LAPGAPPRTLLGRKSHRKAKRDCAAARDGGRTDGILCGAQARCGGGSRTEQTLEQRRDTGAPQASGQAALAADPRAPCPPRSASLLHRLQDARRGGPRARRAPGPPAHNNTLAAYLRGAERGRRRGDRN
jgi:hypothetical protein